MRTTFYNIFKQLPPFKKKETYILISLILFSIIIRIPVIFVFGDTSLDNEWEGLVNNLIFHKSLQD